MKNDRLDNWLAGLAGRKIEDTRVSEEVCSRIPLWAELAPALPSNATGAWLVFRVAQEVRAVPLNNGKVVGRAAPADILIDCPWLSLCHFALRCTDAGFDLEDLGSKNGTLLGGRRVTRTALVSGDVITVGDQHFLYVDSGADATAPAPSPPRTGGML